MRVETSATESDGFAGTRCRVYHRPTAVRPVSPPPPPTYPPDEALALDELLDDEPPFDEAPLPPEDEELAL